MNIQKFNANDNRFGGLLSHMERLRGPEGKYGNQDINPERTHLNYDISPSLPPTYTDPCPSWSQQFFQGRDVRTRFEEKLEATKERQGRKIRSDAVVLVGAVVTLPAEYKDVTPAQKAEFFQRAYEYHRATFYQPMYQNEVYACVHMDETSPHLHYGFIPVTEDGRLNAHKVVTPARLKTYHPGMDRYLRETIDWYHGGIMREEGGPIEYTTMSKLKAQPDNFSTVRKASAALEPLLDAGLGSRSIKLSKTQGEAVLELLTHSEDLTRALEEQEKAAKMRERAAKALEEAENARESAKEREARAQQTQDIAQRALDNAKKEKQRLEQEGLDEKKRLCDEGRTLKDQYVKEGREKKEETLDFINNVTANARQEVAGLEKKLNTYRDYLAMLDEYDEWLEDFRQESTVVVHLSGDNSDRMKRLYDDTGGQEKNGDYKRWAEKTLDEALGVKLDNIPSLNESRGYVLTRTF